MPQGSYPYHSDIKPTTKVDEKADDKDNKIVNEKVDDLNEKIILENEHAQMK